MAIEVKSDREWTCDNCDTTHDHDLNAAKNITSVEESGNQYQGGII